MGGCVTTMMTMQNNRSLQDATKFIDRKNYGPVNIRVTDDQSDRSGVYRCAKLTPEEHKEAAELWYKGPNVLQTLQKNCVERKDRHALAYRTVAKKTVEKQVDEKGREHSREFIHLNDPTYVSYSDLWELLTAFGKGLAELGFGAGDKVALYEETRWEWLTSMVGLWTQGMVGVTVYANLGYDALAYALREADCGVIVCNGSVVGRVAQFVIEKNIRKPVIVYLDELPAGTDTKGLRAIAWGDVVEMGKKSTREFTVPTDNDTTVLIMYTSGTTGDPKGVIHSIGGLTQGAKGLEQRLTELIGQEENETYVCYLPAAHIFEFVCEMIFLSRGILLCFGSPRTLTDAFARPCGDLTQFKPFFMIGVPRIFETIKKTVESRIPPDSFKRRVFDHAYASRLEALRQGKDTPYWNEKVFKLPRSILGGNMRGICSGGAPLADSTQEWMNVVLCCPVAQGYGMTETVCNATIQRIGELTCVAGQLLRGVECLLLDTEDYKHTDKPHPRGELCLRGPSVFKGYYKQPEMTKEVMLPGGWLRTGDVAEIHSHTAQIRIIGRVKALAKNALGEYIALETLEALYCTHPLVAPNGICVLVNPHKSYITALILTDEHKAMTFAKNQGIEGTWPEILKDPKFNEAAAVALSAVGKKAGKMGFELLRHVRVLADEWTPENNLVTASLKVRRTIIDKHYADIIKELFADP